MISNSFKDFKRYLQVTRVLKSIEVTPLCFILKNNSRLFPHPQQSLFEELSIDENIVLKAGDRDFYGISHKDGNLYIQSMAQLRTIIDGLEISDGNYLCPVTEFKNIKDVIKNKDANKFIHLHNHSENSSLDGMSKAEDMARRAKQLDIPALAITDHGNMSGIINFYKACKKYGVKPIIGEEFYFDDDRFAKGPPEEFKKSNKGTDKKQLTKLYEKEHRIKLRRHIILLAKNDKGLKNLYKLSSLAFLEGFYYSPRIDWELLKKYSEGLICTTACISGMVSPENERQQLINLDKLIRIFGREDLYLETTLISYTEQPVANENIFKLAKKYNFKTIVTVDSHYIDPDVDHIHHVYMKIGSGWSYGEGDTYLKTYSELKETYNKFYTNNDWSDYEAAIKTTFEVADKCNVEIELGKFKLPIFKLEDAWGYQAGDTNEKYMLRRIMEGWKKKITSKVRDNLKVYEDRLKHEYKTLVEAGYVNYMLIVLDLIDWVRRQNGIINVRGSAAGSLVCFVMDITQVDPIEEELLFERFVSPLRAGLIDKSYQSPPDIDIDTSGRSEAIEYLTNKYGKDCVARVGTFNRSQLRAAIKSIAAVTEFMKPDVANKLTKTIPDLVHSLDDALDLPEFSAWYDKEKNKAWFDKYVEPILGLVGHGGINAAGVVIAPGPIINYAPVKLQEKKKEEETDQDIDRLTQTQFDKDAVEEIGLLKFDLLGSKTLKRLALTRDLVKERRNIEIYYPNIDLKNPKFYVGYKNLDTLGIFQFDTQSTSKLLKLAKVNNFKELTAINALARPGTAGPGLDEEYCRRKFGKHFEYDHPLLEPVLNETWGIACYQEQIMYMSSAVGGLTLVEADDLRRIMKKKDHTKMKSYQEKFIKGALKINNMDREESQKLFNIVKAFSKYGFCKAHSCAYAQQSVWTMAVKTLVPFEFYIGLLQYPKSKSYLSEAYKDIRNHNISVILPNVNKSTDKFYIDGDSIVWALSGAKGIDKAAKFITESAPYNSIVDFVDRCEKSDKKVVDALISINAFSDLYESPRDAALEYYTKVRKKELPADFDVKDEKYWNKKFKKLMGFYLTDPVEFFREELSPYGRLDSYQDFIDFNYETDVRMAGTITFCKFHTISNGVMAFIKIEVDFKIVNIIMWPSFLSKHGIRNMEPEDVVGRFIYIYGVKQYDRKGDDQIVLSNFDQEDFQFLE